MPVRAVGCLETLFKHVMAGALGMFSVLFFLISLARFKYRSLGHRL